MNNFVHLFSHAQATSLTGCTKRVVRHLMQCCERPIQLGRPFGYSLHTELVITLIKLRTNLSYRAIEVITGIDSVTASRMVRRILACLRIQPLLLHTRPCRYLIVDATHTRIGSSNIRYYSGYKHYRSVKTQVVCDDQKRIHAISYACAGSVHDKALWNRTAKRIVEGNHVPILADKAYAGADYEGTLLVRPAKRNENTYRKHRKRAKDNNRKLSALRVKVEHVIASLKRFKIVRERFPLALSLFHSCMWAAAVIHNMELKLK